jgi:hypothetical protein
MSLLALLRSHFVQQEIGQWRISFVQGKEVFFWVCKVGLKKLKKKKKI